MVNNYHNHSLSNVEKPISNDIVSYPTPNLVQDQYLNKIDVSKHNVHLERNLKLSDTCTPKPNTYCIKTDKF